MPVDGDKIVVQASFLTKFKAEYGRNQHSSSRGGKKNLKCFPQCVKKIHGKGHVCASSVLVQCVSMEDSVVCFGRFSCVNEDTSASDSRISIGDEVDINAIESSPDVWWKGTQADGTNFEFNGRHAGWHYGVKLARFLVDMH